MLSERLRTSLTHTTDNTQLPPDGDATAVHTQDSAAGRNPVSETPRPRRCGDGASFATRVVSVLCLLEVPDARPGDGSTLALCRGGGLRCSWAPRLRPQPCALRRRPSSRGDEPRPL